MYTHIHTHAKQKALTGKILSINDTRAKNYDSGEAESVK